MDLIFEPKLKYFGKGKCEKNIDVERIFLRGIEISNTPTCYPQMLAVKSIWLFWRQPVKGMKGKKHLERNVMGNEVFTEAIPTSLIMTFLMVVEVMAGPGTEYVPNEVYELLVENGPTLFYVTFVTSYLSAGLGLAKCLKVISFPLSSRMTVSSCLHHY